MDGNRKLCLGLIALCLGMVVIQNYLTLVASDQIRTEQQCLDDFEEQLNTDLCLQGLEQWHNEFLPKMQLRDNFWWVGVVIGIILFFYIEKEKKIES